MQKRVQEEVSKMEWRELNIDFALEGHTLKKIGMRGYFSRDKLQDGKTKKTINEANIYTGIRTVFAKPSSMEEDVF